MTKASRLRSADAARSYWVRRAIIERERASAASCPRAAAAHRELAQLCSLRADGELGQGTLACDGPEPLE